MLVVYQGFRLEGLATFQLVVSGSPKLRLYLMLESLTQTPLHTTIFLPKLSSNRLKQLKRINILMHVKQYTPALYLYV